VPHQQQQPPPLQPHHKPQWQPKGPHPQAHPSTGQEAWAWVAGGTTTTTRTPGTQTLQHTAPGSALSLNPQSPAANASLQPAKQPSMQVASGVPTVGRSAATSHPHPRPHPAPPLHPPHPPPAPTLPPRTTQCSSRRTPLGPVQQEL
jgi:hypothetical protein